MNNESKVVGIDVSKARLDAAVDSLTASRPTSPRPGEGVGRA